MKYALCFATVVAAATCISASPVEIAARQYSNQTQSSNQTQNTGGQQQGSSSNQGSSSSQGSAGGNTGMMVGNVAQGLTDGDVFNVALTLEHLESAFYAQALNNYTASDFQNAGLPAAFINNVATLSYQEDVHVAYLEGALGGNAVQPCEYTFPATNPATFLNFATRIEGVGVSAYLGGAGLIQDKNSLLAAGSVLAVEARHTAYLRYARSFLTNGGEIPATEKAPFPSPFDIPLTPSEAYTIASRYIVSCPEGNAAKLSGITQFPLLNLLNTESIVTGSTIEVQPQSGFQAQGQSLYAAFPTVNGPIIQPVFESSNGYSTTVPAGLTGQAYIVLTNSAITVDDSTIVAGPALLQVNNPTF